MQLLQFNYPFLAFLHVPSQFFWLRHGAAQSCRLIVAIKELRALRHSGMQALHMFFGNEVQLLQALCLHFGAEPPDPSVQ